MGRGNAGCADDFGNANRSPSCRLIRYDVVFSFAAVFLIYSFVLSIRV
jgi:hypothetical protein